MTMLSDKTIRYLCKEVGLVQNMIDPERQIQPCGVDLTLDYVEEPQRPTVFPTVIDFTNEKRKIAPMKRCNVFTEDIYEIDDGSGIKMTLSTPIQDYWYELQQGQYVFHTREKINCPQGISGFMLLRSTLCRGGNTCTSALIDPGYFGHLTLTVNVGMAPLTIKRGGRFAQVIFFRLDSDAGSTYNGVYKENKPSG